MKPGTHRWYWEWHGWDTPAATRTRKNGGWRCSKCGVLIVPAMGGGASGNVLKKPALDARPLCDDVIVQRIMES